MATLYVNADYIEDDNYVSTGITVNWPTKEIFVPKIAMLRVQTDPIEIYQLDIDVFRLALKKLEGEETGMPYLDTHSHVAPISVGGVDLARVVSIINDYTVTFEDGKYAVDLVGGNSNIGDRVNINNVSVRSANSAGLPNLDAIQAASFSGQVHVKAGSPYSGTTYPVGTQRYPVNNVPDARAIMEVQQADQLHIIGNYTFDTGDDISGINVLGSNAATTLLIINPGALTQSAHITDATVTGTLDGGTLLERCVISNLDYVNGFVYKSMLAPGTITLGGTATAYFLDCYSGVPGTNTPTVDMNGTGNEDTPLVFRNYSGGIKLIEKTGSGAVSLDFVSGQAIVDSSCVDGTIVLRGNTKCVDENGNHIDSGVQPGTTLTVLNEALHGNHLHDIWYKMGLDAANAGNSTQLLTPEVIAALVWEEQITDHQTVGTMGYAQSQTSGLSSEQNTMLMEMYRLMGLDPTKPLIVTNTTRDAGVEISQTINCTDNITTVTRI